jgi:hypothetical protein
MQEGIRYKSAKNPSESTFGADATDVDAAIDDPTIVDVSDVDVSA